MSRSAPLTPPRDITCMVPGAGFGAEDCWGSASLPADAVTIAISATLPNLTRIFFTDRAPFLFWIDSSSTQGAIISSIVAPGRQGFGKKWIYNCLTIRREDLK